MDADDAQTGLRREGAGEDLGAGGGEGRVGRRGDWSAARRARFRARLESPVLPICNRALLDAPEVEVVQGNLVTESALLSEFELILRKVLRQNIAVFFWGGNTQNFANLAMKLKFNNLKTFLFSMKTATLRLFSLKKFTTPLIIMAYFLLMPRGNSFVCRCKVRQIKSKMEQICIRRIYTDCHYCLIKTQHCKHVEM